MDAKAMLAAVQAALSGRGATAEMLVDGLPHALEGGLEDRHDLQSQLLKMVAKALGAACAEAEEAEAASQRSADAAQAEWDARKGALADAAEAMAGAQAAATAKQERLRECETELVNEEQEHRRVDAANRAKAEVVDQFVEKKRKVVGLLEGAGAKGSADAVVEHLKASKCDPALVAALPSIYAKEPADRTGFDLVALAALRAMLEKQAAAADAGMETARANKVNVHAESLGAWAVMEVARGHVQEATEELEAAEKNVEAERENVRQATQAAEQEERTLSQRVAELTLASEKARQCRAALEALRRLEAGQEAAPEPEATSPVAVAATAAVDAGADLLAAKLDASPAAGLSSPIAA